MKRSKLVLAVLFALFSLLVIPCSAQSQQGNIIGKWFFEDFLEDTVIIEFTETQMIITEISQSQIETIEYKIVGEKLFWDDEIFFELEMPDVYTIKLSINYGDSIFAYTGTKLQTQNISSLSGMFLNETTIGFTATLQFIDEKNVYISGITSFDDMDFILGEYEIISSYLIIKFADERFPEIYGALRIMEIISDSILRGDIFMLGGHGYYFKKFL